MKEDLFTEMEADAQVSQIESLTNDGLGGIAELARKVRQKKTEFDSLEAQAAQCKKELLKITDEDLPNLLQELGISSFSLEDGSKVELRTIVGTHIKVENREEAYAWLKAHDFDDIIKNITSCQFGRGEDQKASDFVELAAEHGYVLNQKREIHHNTLTAFVRERIEKGENFPMELFGAFVGQRATIKGAKSNG